MSDKKRGTGGRATPAPPRVRYIIGLTEEQLVTMLTSFGERLLGAVGANTNRSDEGYVLRRAVGLAGEDIPRIAKDVVFRVLHP